MVPLRGIVVFTVIEVATLAVWLGLAGTVLGGIVLVGGLFLEHVIAHGVKNGKTIWETIEEASVLQRDIPFGKIAVNAVLETVLWIVWLALWPIDTTGVLAGLPILATLFLAPALVVEHSLSDNILRDAPLLRRLFKRQVIGFSLVEAAGATAWLALIGAGVPALGLVALAIASFVEHRMAIAVARRL